MTLSPRTLVLHTWGQDGAVSGEVNAVDFAGAECGLHLKLVDTLDGDEVMRGADEFHLVVVGLSEVRVHDHEFVVQLGFRS